MSENYLSATGPGGIDPNLDAASLQQLAVAEPAAWPQIVSHPNAYPELIIWIREQEAARVAPAAPAAEVAAQTVQGGYAPQQAVQQPGSQFAAQQPNPRIPGAVNAATKMVPAWLAILLAVFGALLLLSLFVPLFSKRYVGLSVSVLEIQQLDGYQPAFITLIIIALALIGTAIASLFVTGSQIRIALGVLSLIAAANALYNVVDLYSVINPVVEIAGMSLTDVAAVGFYLMAISGLGLLVFGILVWVLKRSNKTPEAPSFQ